MDAFQMTKFVAFRDTGEAGHAPDLRWLAPLLCIFLLAGTPAVVAQEREGIGEAEVAALARRAMSEFDVPGMAIGIVKEDEILLAEG